MIPNPIRTASTPYVRRLDEADLAFGPVFAEATAKADHERAKVGRLQEQVGGLRAELEEQRRLLRDSAERTVSLEHSLQHAEGDTERLSALVQYPAS